MQLEQENAVKFSGGVFAERVIGRGRDVRTLAIAQPVLASDGFREAPAYIGNDNIDDRSESILRRRSIHGANPESP
jgi:hypothetical protein